ncbi:MAG: RIP metalloprotease RseP [Thermodesulfobacteriota bacterium]
MVTSVIAAIVVLGLLIFVHELGHFLACKRVGVGVLKFSLGFGPTLFSRRVGETEYVVAAIPLGGYVKMIGQEDDGSEPDPATASQPNSFAVKPLWARALIVVAGPLGNLVFAALLLALLFATGVPVLSSTVGNVSEGMPAAQAGLQAGDEIVAVDGEPIDRWEQLSNAIRASDGKPVELEVRRGAEEFSVRLTPQRTEGKTIFGEATPIYVIGVEQSDKIFTERSNPIAAIWLGIQRTAELVGLTVLTLVKLFQGVVSASTVGGPLTIMTEAGKQAHNGFAALAFFMALLSVNLGVLNLLPIPILDGGHLLFMGVEKILGHPMEIRHREIAQSVGMFLLISLMVFALYNDLHRLVVG